VQQGRNLADSGQTLTLQLHRAFDDAEIFALIRGEVLAEPLDMLAKVAEKACDARAAPAEARNAISRQLLILAQIEPRIAGASAHAFGIGVGTSSTT